ncbi:MAG: hypothetical protein OJF58_000783 [Enhydrobacter sp.]|nr:MAG: hypothetical protein OJF58_000783 [Enhydrobacter sp.]
MDAPFVFAAEARRRPVDHQLALAQAERTLVEQASGKHPGEDARIARHGTEQHQRLEAGRHDAVQRLGNVGFIRRLGRGDSRHDGTPFRCYNFSSIGSEPSLQKM